MIQIAVGGAQGRMGRLVSDLIQADPSTSLAAAITKPTKTSGGLAAITDPIDVFIDFTTLASVPEHVKICTERQIPMVIGVTGLSLDQKQAIQVASKTIPILLSPNLSIGMNVSFKLLELAARLFQKTEETPEIAISEIHHRHKKDAPSGTAKKMAEIVALESGKTIQELDIQFSSLRLGEVTGDHQILFSLDDEQLAISHSANNRVVFARGALTAAKWLYQKPPGLYDMQDVFSLC